MKQYLKYVKPYAMCFILSPVLMGCEVIGEVLLPTLMAQIINVGAVNKDVPYILSVGVIMLAIVAFMMAGGIGSAYFASKAAVSFSSDLRRDVFLKVQKFSFKNIDDFSTGSLITRLTNDITQLQNLIMMSLRMLIRAPGMLLGAGIMAYRMNPAMARVIFIVVPCMAAAIGLIISFGFPRFTIMQEKIDSLNNTIREALTNVRIIKSFVREDFEKKRFGAANEDLKDSSLSAFYVVILNMPVVTLAMNVAVLGAVWIGGLQVLAGTMPVGHLTAMTTYIVQVLISLMILAMILLQSSRAIASGKRISEVLDAKVDLTDDEASMKDELIKTGSVEFKDVSFSYYKENEQKVLNDISFSIPSGATVGIVGSTGCGKTSLVQLIPRLYDADGGTVFVDGKDVKELSLKHLRDSVSMVLQKNELFSGTVADNLRWGDENASMEEMKQAAISAQADGFVNSFPEGYETKIERGGSNVSGGQKQRLCIARALLKKPKILILDDSTSAVDTATEAMIRKAFSTTLKDTTKIIIAQRISSVMESDFILVLEEGRIVGNGSHEELLESCSTYKEIYDSQNDSEYEKEVSA